MTTTEGPEDRKDMEINAEGVGMRNLNEQHEVQATSVPCGAIHVTFLWSFA